MKRVVGCLCIGLLTVLFAGCNRIYVDKNNSSPLRDGKSWQTAYRTLQEGVDKAAEMAASSGKNTEIWVAKGTYNEAREGNAENPGSLLMRAGVYIYGGFKGDETDADARDPVANPVIIDGSTSNAGNPAFHTVVGADGCGLDSVTITGGVAANVTSTNQTQRKGGGLYLSGGAMLVGNCVFTGNRAQYGGAVYMENTSPWFTACTFKANSVHCASSLMNTHGGGICMKNSGPTFSKCLIAENSGEYCMGAGVYASDGSHPFYSECDFFMNLATLGECYGGGVFEVGCNSSFKTCRFAWNRSVYGGHCVHGVNTTSVLTDCVFKDDSESSTAVFISDRCNYTFKDSSFTECMGTEVSAIQTFLNVTCTVDNCIFSGNGTPSTIPQGAVIDAQKSTSLVVRNSEFNGNVIGGVTAVQTANTTIANCRFDRTHEVAAVRLSAWGGDAEPCSADIVNCVFNGCDAGALYVDWGMTANVTNCTFYGNTGPSAVIEAEAYATAVNVKNSILWNSTPAHFAILPGEGDVALSVTYSDVQGGYAGTGNLWINPMFVGAEFYENFHLNPMSNLRDKGTPDGAPADDLDGNVRDALPDMGAYEVVAG